jgi:hypothetical protein
MAKPAEVTGVAIDRPIFNAACCRLLRGVGETPFPFGRP